MIKSFRFLLLVWLLVLPAGLWAADAEKPNLVIFLSDDHTL